LRFHPKNAVLEMARSPLCNLAPRSYDQGKAKNSQAECTPA
jgi:hypothetical protein